MEDEKYLRELSSDGDYAESFGFKKLKIFFLKANYFVDHRFNASTPLLLSNSSSNLHGES